MNVQHEIKRVHQRVPKWLMNPTQYNSTILTKFLELSVNDKYKVKYNDLKKECNFDTFDSNYNQMKNGGEKNHAKVFNESNEFGEKIITLWKPVKDFILSEWEKSGIKNNDSGEKIFNVENQNLPTIEKQEIKQEIKKEQITQSIKTKNILLYGAPGVGKTHNYKRLLYLIEEDYNQNKIFQIIQNNQPNTIEENFFIDKIYNELKEEELIEFVVFHQSYSYEDFIEGFRPQENGKIELEDGIFKMIADRALKNSSKNHYIIIDEINRGNISKIFGELITLIEEDKRDSYEVTLPYSKEKFKIPSNLYIIATMNSTDKSIATMDIALRRRFTFVKMQPNLALVEDEKARALMKNLNEYIKAEIGEEYQLGHSYFMGKDIDLDFVLEYKIKPLLEEYFYGEDTDIDSVIQTAKRDFDASHS